jgi:ABC-type lipoprotein export system ATPase subunit
VELDIFSDHSGIYYFDQGVEKEFANLKSFLYFLKAMKVKGPIKFAYVDQAGALIPNLSLKENILLDAIPQSLSLNKGTILNNVLEKIDNVFITNMFNSIVDWEQKPSECSSQVIKLVALMKALLTDSKYIFLDNPEMHLRFETLNLFKNALNLQRKKQNQIVIIHSQNFSVWEEEVEKIIYRGENKKFNIIPHVVGQEKSESQDFKQSNVTHFPIKKKDRNAA